MFSNDSEGKHNLGITFFLRLFFLINVSKHSLTLRIAKSASYNERERGRDEREKIGRERGECILGMTANERVATNTRAMQNGFIG